MESEAVPSLSARIPVPEQADRQLGALAAYPQNDGRIDNPVPLILANSSRNGVAGDTMRLIKAIQCLNHLVDNEPHDMEEHAEAPALIAAFREENTVPDGCVIHAYSSGEIREVGRWFQVLYLN